MKKSSIIIVVFLLIVGIQHSAAQQLDIQNKVEYSQESAIDDLNSITLPTKASKKVQKTINQKTVSVKELERMVSVRRSSRYRKVRKADEKCFKETVEDTSCEQGSTKELKEKEED